MTAIHQETVLFDELTVAENNWLGHAPTRSFWPYRLEGDARGAQKPTYLDPEADLDPDLKLRDLGIASKHLVAIARALSIDARV